MFKRYEKKLNMYSVYCRNKQLSECYVQKHQAYFLQLKDKMNHRLEVSFSKHYIFTNLILNSNLFFQLSDLLIKPVQRITKYELLLKEIIKNTDTSGNSEEVQSLKEAYLIVKVSFFFLEILTKKTIFSNEIILGDCENNQ